MPVAVVKLGSSIVAEENGELRLSVVARVCEEVAALHRRGVEVVVVTSGAIARGMQLLGMGARPATVQELQAASAVGQGRLYRTYDGLLRDRGIQTAQVLLTFFDMSARAHYLNARNTLSKLLEWRIVPVINENDTTTTNEVSFGDNDFLAAQVSVLVNADLLVLLTDADGLYTADPRTSPDAKLVGEVTDPGVADGVADRPLALAARLRRHALQGRGGRDGLSRRDPDRDRQRPGRAACSRAPGRASRPAPASRRRRRASRASSCG